MLDASRPLHPGCGTYLPKGIHALEGAHESVPSHREVVGGSRACERVERNEVVSVPATLLVLFRVSVLLSSTSLMLSIWRGTAHSGSKRRREGSAVCGGHAYPACFRAFDHVTNTGSGAISMVPTPILSFVVSISSSTICSRPQQQLTVHVARQRVVAAQDVGSSWKQTAAAAAATSPHLCSQ